MKKTVFSLLVALAVVGCGSASTSLRPMEPVAALQYDIDQILADSIFVPARAAVKIVSLSSGQILYDRNSDMLMRPASNMKLLTSSAGLNYLGSEFEFRTLVHADSIDTSGVVQGNLYLKGYGNPDLTTDDLDSIIVRDLAGRITSVTGDIIADVSYFDDLYWGEGWMWDDEPYSYEALITPLSVNDNCVEVSVIPGYYAGDSALVSIEPRTTYVDRIGGAVTVTDSVRRRLRITRLYKERLNTIVVDGEVLASPDTITEQVTVWKPELYAAQLFKERLQQHGIAVSGGIRIGSTPLHSPTLAIHTHPFDSMVVNLNKVSDNLSAEITLKTIAAEMVDTPGTATHGISKVYEFLSGFGIDTTRILMVDGSGVSHYNLLTAGMLVQLLAGMAGRTDLFPLFYESLPIAGVDGTLERRMRRTPAEGNLRAKTGSLSGVSSLSGYVKTLDGETLVFSMMMQNFITPSRLYRNAQDAIGALLARFSRKGLFM